MNVHRRGFLRAAVASAAAATTPALARQVQPPAPPAVGDDSQASLADFLARLAADHGGSRNIPLARKAEIFEWELWRYHLTSENQVYNQATLPQTAGQRPTAWPASDTSTWNGALLSGLSCKYAVTQDAATLERLCALVEGLQFFFTVTETPGVPARCLARERVGILAEVEPLTHVAADGGVWLFHGNAAKGTLNQITLGLAALLMLAGGALPVETRRTAQRLLADMALHLLRHDFHITERGRRTSSGDLTPLVGSTGVPFNAQVAYVIVAAAHTLAGEAVTAEERAELAGAIAHLRGRHHVYYEAPLRSLIQPQRVGASPLVKGTNDRNHLLNAAYVGLLLERHAAVAEGRAMDERFVYELGQSAAFAIRYLTPQRNSLCNFMWLGLLTEPAFAALLAGPPTDGLQVWSGDLLSGGVEQLTRFDLDRFNYPGNEVESNAIVWCDEFRPDDYWWKCTPNTRFERTGPPIDRYYAAFDYLHAYWLLRYWRLEESPLAAGLREGVLQPVQPLGLTPS